MYNKKAMSTKKRIRKNIKSRNLNLTIWLIIQMNFKNKDRMYSNKVKIIIKMIFLIT